MREDIDRLKAEYRAAIEAEKKSGCFWWANIDTGSDEPREVFEARSAAHRRDVEVATAELLAEGHTAHLMTV